MQVSGGRSGFSGNSPREIAQQFAAGKLTKAQVIDELGRWPYLDAGHPDEYDDLWEPGPGTWLDVEDAHSDGLIDDAVYAAALELRAARKAATPGASTEVSTPEMFPEVVSHLREMLGAVLVAYLGEVLETRTVRTWAEGTGEPSESVAERLRLAHTVVQLLEARFDRVTISSWFQGMNPQLGDRSPASVLRGESAEDARAAVVAAARGFLWTG